MSLSHSTYISNLLTKFGMENCKPVSTPLAEKLTLSKVDSPVNGSDEEKQPKQLDYRGLVGSMSYLARTTRPDLAFSAHLHSRFLSNLGQAHWQAAKHVLRYLRGTLDVGQTFWRASRAHLTGFSDYDYATCKDDHKSVAGYCFNYGSAAISYSSKKQTCVATSFTEAELHALNEASKEALHLQAILQTLGRPASATLMCHSQSSLALVKRDNGTPKAKHFATRLAFVRDMLQNTTRAIKLDFVTANDNQEDLFTKGLGKTNTQQHLQHLSAKWGCQSER